MVDDKTDFAEGQEVYICANMGMSLSRVLSVKWMKTRGGLRVTIKTEGGGTWDGNGHPKDRSAWSTTSIRARTPDLDADYKRQRCKALVISSIADGQINLWDDEELDLIADAVRVAKMMRQQRILPLKMDEAQFKAALAALPQKGQHRILAVGISTAHAKQYAAEVFQSQKVYTYAELVAGVTKVDIHFT